MSFVSSQSSSQACATTGRTASIEPQILNRKILRIGVHPYDFAHRLAVEPGEQRRGRGHVVDRGGRHQS